LERYRQIENAGNDIVMPVEQVIVAGNAQVEIDAFFENIIRNGGEGIVLKPAKMSVYTDGRRLATYLKRKPFETDEFEVVGHYNTDKAATKGEGYVSSLVLRTKVSSLVLLSKSKTFKVSYKNFNAPAVGEMVTVRYSDTTVTGLPKFPVYIGKRFKEDDSKDCKEPTTPATPALVIPALAKLKIAAPEAAKPDTAEASAKTHVEASAKTHVEASAKTLVEASAKTYAEWEAAGGYELSHGESVLVISATNPSIQYKVTKATSGTSVYCSCPAWKFQKLNPAVRTCKHCIAVCGAKAERVRCALATMCLQQMNDLMGKSYKI